MGSIQAQAEHYDKLVGWGWVWAYMSTTWGQLGPIF